MSDFGQRLKSYRKSKGLSVPKVSILTGIPADRIYKWEKGTKPQTGEDILTIEKFISGNLSNVSRETFQENQPNTIEVSVNKGLIETLLQTQNKILTEIKDGLQAKVEKMDTNLSMALGGVQQLSLHVESAREVILDSLSRLEKKPGSLRGEADKKVVQLMKERSKQDNAVAKDR